MLAELFTITEKTEYPYTDKLKFPVKETGR